MISMTLPRFQTECSTRTPTSSGFKIIRISYRVPEVPVVPEVPEVGSRGYLVTVVPVVVCALLADHQAVIAGIGPELDELSFVADLAHRIAAFERHLEIAESSIAAAK